MLELFIKGVFIGIVFGVPAGAIGALTLGRSLQYGFVPGFVTGLGSTVADMIYALAGVFGITLIEDFITKWQSYISLVGGVILAIMGIAVYQKRNEHKNIALQDKEKSTKEKLPVLGMFGSSFVIAMLNPATIVSFIAVFAMLHVNTEGSVWNGIGLVAGIALGTVIWWTGLSVLGAKLRETLAEKMYQRVHRMMGMILVGLGVIMVVHGI